MFKEGERKRISRNTFWLFGEKIIRFLIGILVTALLIRYLGPEQFGLYSYVFSFVLLFEPLVSLGSSSITIRDLVQQRVPGSVIMGSGFLVRLSGGFLGFLLINIIAYMHEIPQSNLRILIMIMSVSSIFKSLEIIDSYFQANIESRYVVWSRVIAFIFASSLRLLFVCVKGSLLIFIIIMVLEPFFYILGFLYFYSRRASVKLLSWRFDWAYVKSFLKDSVPLFLSGVAVTLYLRIDQVMLKGLDSEYAVGIYSAAVRLSEIWHFLPLAIVASFFPSIIAMKKENEEGYWYRFRILFSFMSALAIFLALFMALAGETLIYMLFSDKYAASVPVFRIHIWSCLFVFWGVLQHPWDVSENLLKRYLMRTFAGAFTNILLNLYMIPKWGPVGAAWSTLISFSVSSFLLNIIGKENRQLMRLMIYSLDILKWPEVARVVLKQKFK